MAVCEQGGSVVGGSQAAVGHRDQRERPGERVQVPALILIASIRLARFGIDCTGPAVASEAREPVGVPGPWVGHHSTWRHPTGRRGGG